MNIRDLPPGHWVVAHLPDGRTAIAGHDDPIVKVMRRLSAAGLVNRAMRYPGNLGDYAAVADWLDAREPPAAGQLQLWQEAA